MKTNETLDDDFSSNLLISAASRTFLKETAKWAIFIAIVGFVMIGLMVLASFFIGTILSTMMMSEIPGAEIPGTFITIFYIILAGIGFIPMLYLYKFANKMQLALENDNQGELEESLQNLKSHYKFYGIFLVIILTFYAFMIVIAVIGRIFG